VVVGGGASQRLFADAADRVPLDLVDVQRFATDVLRIKYAKAA
jgi:hypothetical protein